VFPSCSGLADHWSFDLHPRTDFRLNADHDSELVLHVNSTGSGYDAITKVLEEFFLSFDFWTLFFGDRDALWC
jgi:hypothetical protein